MRGMEEAFVRGYDPGAGEAPERWELGLGDRMGTPSVVEVTRPADGVFRADLLWEGRFGEFTPPPRCAPVRRPTLVGVDMIDYREKPLTNRKTWYILLLDEEGRATQVSLTRLKDGWFIALPTGRRADSGSQSRSGEFVAQHLA